MAISRDDVQAYYAHFGEREWDRLTESAYGAVEFAVTCHALDTHLPPGGRVLDTGGGPGRYTIWLAQRGYRVVLADFSPEMLAIARAKIAEAGVTDQVEAVVEADACDLGQWLDDSFAAVLSLGPFYHLPDASEREQAAEELVRVLYPGGLAFIALMPRYTFLRRTIALSDERHHLLQPDWVTRLLGEGVFHNDVPGRFTYGYGVRPEEVAPFFEGHGLSTLALLATEGITAGIETALAELAKNDPSTYREVLNLIIQTADDPTILGTSLHLLYIGRKA